MFKKYKNPLILAIISGLAIVIYLSVTMPHPTGDNEDSDTVLLLGNKNIAPLVYEEKGVAKGLTVDIVKESKVLKDKWISYSRKYSYARDVEFEETLKCLEQFINIIVPVLV